MPENTTTEQHDEDLRASLEAAYDEKSDIEEPEASDAAPSDENDSNLPENTEDSGENTEKTAENRSLKEEIDENSAKTNEKGEKKPFVEVKKPNQAPQPEVEPEKTEKDPIAKAPQAWKPEAREHWDAIPEEARREIVRHEQQVKEALRDTAEARQFAQAVTQTLQPYQQFIKAEGSNPIQAIDNLMSTAAALRTGNADQVAQLVTQITNQFGIGRFGKEFVRKLDESLSGAAPKEESPEVKALREQYERELAPLKQMHQQMQQQQYYQAQQANQATQSELQQFASQAEFLEDVRMDMADLMDLAAQQGRELSLQEAYDRACWANPEIRNVLTRRQQAQQAQQVNEKTQRAKKAAVSVSGSAPVSQAQASNGANLREDLEFAISQLSR